MNVVVHVRGTWLELEAGRRARRRGSAPVEVAIRGPLTMLSVAQQEAAIVEAIRDTGGTVVLDLSEVTRVSSVGARMLDYLRASLEREGRELVLVGTHPELLARVEQTGLGLLVPLYASTELALAQHAAG